MQDKISIEMSNYEDFLRLARAALGFLDLLDVSNPIDTDFLYRCLDGSRKTLSRLERNISQVIEENLQHEEAQTQTQWDE